MVVPEDALEGITVAALVRITEDNTIRPEKFYLETKYPHPEVIQATQFDHRDTDGRIKHFIIEDILAIRFAASS